MYDIIAKRSTVYAYIYPFIELALGLSYLFGIYPLYTNIVTLIISIIGSIGVAQILLKRQKIMCACIGAVFKVPMTWVTFFEDVFMAFMAAAMIYMIRG